MTTQTDKDPCTAKCDDIIKKQAAEIKSLKEFSGELVNVIDTLVYWNDRGHVDDSWWEEARRISALHSQR